MTSTPFDARPTSRRRFVLDVVGGLAGGALAAGCGTGSELRTRTGSDGTGGAENAGAPGAAGTPPDGGSGGSSGADPGAGGNAVGGAGMGNGGAPAQEAGTCALYPQQTEGPFYLDLDLLRNDIAEGKPGTPLDLELEVIRAGSCAPIANAVVDIWQCDADGVYSGFPGQLGGLDTTGQKFLRGTQVTGTDGRVVFRTIYPGWYPGRTTHIHFKVHLTANTQVTSQMYFPEDRTSTVYYSPPYSARGQKDTSNAADSIAQSGGFPPVLAVTPGSVVKAKLTVTVLG